MREEIYKRGKFYYIDTTINGRRIRKSTGKNTLKEALDFLENLKNQKEEEPKKQEKPCSSFECCCLKFLENKEKVLRPKTFNEYKSLIKRLKTFFCKKDLKKLTKKDIYDYIVFRQLKIKDAYIKKELQLLKNIINFCIDIDILDKNILDNNIFFKELKNYEPNERFLTTEEIKNLLNNCNDYLRRLIVFLLETGLRINEALNLLFTDVCVDEQTGIKYIVIRKEISKNKKERFVPLSNLAIEQVANQKKEFDGIFIFTDKYGRSYKTTPKKALHNAFIKAGVEPAGFHIFRHTFASLKLQGLSIFGEKIKPLNINIISKLLGHSNSIITSNVYAKYCNNDLLLSIF